MSNERPDASATASSAPRRFGTILSILLCPFARRFIAGTALESAIVYTKILKNTGFQTTLDHLGESVEDREEAISAAESYIEMLRTLKLANLDLNVSLKLTQMGLSIDRELCFENLMRVVSFAEGIGGFVRVDMEGSDTTEATIEMVEKAKRREQTPIGIVIQAMLKRSPRDVDRLIAKGIPVRLCKGAYKEPQDVAYQDMKDIRRQFLDLAKRLITSKGYHAIATHDPLIIEEIKTFATARSINPDRFEFQMLLGIRQSLQKKIIADGWKLRIYVPFGSSWLPYTWRRIRERKENLWFAIKGMFAR